MSTLPEGEYSVQVEYFASGNVTSNVLKFKIER